MSKYVIYWETIDPSKLGQDPKENVKSLEAVKKSLEGTAITDWFACPDGMKGYLLADGDAKGVNRILSDYTRFVSYEVQEVITLDEVIETVKSKIT